MEIIRKSVTLLLKQVSVPQVREYLVQELEEL